MFQQLLFLEEYQPTVLTNKILFPQVSPSVLHNAVGQAEGFVTFVTLIRFLPRVQALVDLQVARLDEGLVAHVALVRAHAGMVPAVAQELVAR